MGSLLTGYSGDANPMPLKSGAEAFDNEI